MEHRVHLTCKEHPESLQSHWLVPVTLNNRGPFAFAVEPSRSRTLITARTLYAIGIAVEDDAPTVATSGSVYPLATIQSIAVGGATVNDIQVVQWGQPVIPPELLGSAEEKLIVLGTEPSTAISSILECRGILGLDFLRHFTLSFDFGAETLILRDDE